MPSSTTTTDPLTPELLTLRQAAETAALAMGQLLDPGRTR